MGLLTKEEIKCIKVEVAASPFWGDPNCLGLAINRLDIIQVSIKSGLILFSGDSTTGFHHIVQRHGFFTFQKFKFIEGQNGKQAVIDNPSRLSPDTVPAFDYLNLAEHLYHPENLNSKDNKSPQEFELYSAEWTSHNGVKELYYLLIYKGTKIVHNLYPRRGKHNLKLLHGFNYRRGGVAIQHDIKHGIVKIKIPYYNEKEKLCYTILLLREVGSDKEKVLIFVHKEESDREGFFEVGERKLNNYTTEDQVAFLNITLQFSDLREIEEYIKIYESQH